VPPARAPARPRTFAETDKAVCVFFVFKGVLLI